MKLLPSSSPEPAEVGGAVTGRVYASGALPLWLATIADMAGGVVGNGSFWAASSDTADLPA